MQIKPLYDQILVKQSTGEQVRASGIIIPEAEHNGGPVEGVVIALGCGRLDKKTFKTIPIGAKVGDVIMWSHRSGEQVDKKDDTLFIIQEDDIMFKKTGDYFKPLSNRVLIKRRHKAEKSPGGVIIPESAANPVYQGEVIAQGPGERMDDGRIQSICVDDGDDVFFAKSAGTEVEVDGEVLIIMREDNLIGVLAESQS